jgi:hypothetical protein
MTLALATITTSGIVLSADSRQTYKNGAGMIRIGSDNGMKLFKLNDRSGVVISGRAFLQDKNNLLKNTGWFIETFKRTLVVDGLSIKEIAQKLNSYLSDLFIEKEKIALEKQIKELILKQGGTELNIKPMDGNFIPYSYKNKDGKIIEDAGSVDNIIMIVAGIDDDKIGRAYYVNVPKGIIFERNTTTGGATWIGQTDVLVRIILGFAPEIRSLDYYKNLDQATKISIEEQIKKLEYIINWGTMTLQDAIDFCILMTRTTESIQRFSDGTCLTPGGITGVGGDIDIAVITPEKGFVWFKKKKLKIENETVDLDKYQDIIIQQRESGT